MWIRLTGRGFRFWFVKQPLAFIRRHEGNMSKAAVRMKRNSQAVLRNAWQRGDVSRWNIRFWTRAFSVHFAQVAWTHCDEGMLARAFGYLATSVALHPVFRDPRLISEPRFFRLRAFAHFVAKSVRLR